MEVTSEPQSLRFTDLMGASWTSWEFCLFFFFLETENTLLHFEQPIKLKKQKNKDSSYF